ncbi:hypothetical protein [Kitasatospora viridis]|uniref:Transmembrane protein n=1 Tax=Kitasatospora viridis TaxID=281105 RepID=A0A561UE27_9ACTN|nr:hypothetical protein [Kitasatospora viridis]TWF97623.1 hypothetical protein FHX73_111409 [Kitasatospora viridis]
MSTGPGPETEQFAEQLRDHALRDHELAEEAFALPTADLLLPLDPDRPLDLPPDPVVLEREIRPRRRLRWWQLLPIVAIGALGSLMFAFPLAFGPVDGGSMVAMLGLLLTAASVGWGAMAARRAGYAWPGLPRRDSGRRAGWKAIAVYTLIVCTAFGLAVWRVVQLRG